MTINISPVSITSFSRISGSGVPFNLCAERNIGFERGRFTVLLGQNGSGKTTFLEAILGIRLDYSIERTILGSNLADLPNEIKHRIGVSTQIHSYSTGAKVRDVVRLHADAYKVSQNTELLKAFDLMDALGREYSKISGGQKKRLSLYFALAHDPDVAFLDEPEAGLDVQGEETLLAKVQSRSDAGLTTIAATHHSLITERADDVMFMHSGDIVFAGDKALFINNFFEDSVLEIDTGDLSKQDIERMMTVGKTSCFDGLNKDKLLIFARRSILADLRKSSDHSIKERSILRKTKSSDILTWINNRSAPKCAP